jgi:hypothetical protein
VKNFLGHLRFETGGFGCRQYFRRREFHSTSPHDLFRISTGISRLPALDPLATLAFAAYKKI